LVGGRVTVGGRVAVGGVIAGGLDVFGVVVVAACEPPSDPPLQAPHTVSTVSADTALHVLAGLLDREVIELTNLPPRGAPIVRLLRL
jgi:hypothetical protein